MLSKTEYYNDEYSRFVGDQWSKAHVCVDSVHDFRGLGIRLFEVRTVLSAPHVVKQYFSDWSLNLLTCDVQYPFAEGMVEKLKSQFAVTSLQSGPSFGEDNE